MRKILDIAATGLAAVWLHPLRSFVTIASVIVSLVPFLVGTGIARGIRDQAEDSVRFGSDLYVTATQFGRTVPIPLDAMEPIAQLDGVTAVEPRIVGSIVLGSERIPAVFVGLSPDRLGPVHDCVAGRWFTAGGTHEYVVGAELASQLRLQPGSRIPPFYRSRSGERVATVVGVLRRDAPVWAANAVLASFQSASEVFDQPGTATDLLVTCRPGYTETVSRAIVGWGSNRSPSNNAVRWRIVSREDAAAELARSQNRRDGIFQLHFVLACAVGIGVILVTSGIGLAESRREIGILKATGWQTDELLFRGFIESLALSVTAASCAVLMAYVWLRAFNGVGLAAIFIAGVSHSSEFRVPFRLVPVPALLGYLTAFAVIATGTLYASWRAASVPPAEAMR